MQAAWHRGDQAVLLDWIARASLDPFAVFVPGVDGSVVVTERAQGSSRCSVVRVGDVAVQTPGSRYGWDACDEGDLPQRVQPGPPRDADL